MASLSQAADTVLGTEPLFFPFLFKNNYLLQWALPTNVAGQEKESPIPRHIVLKELSAERKRT